MDEDLPLSGLVVLELLPSSLAAGGVDPRIELGLGQLGHRRLLRGRLRQQLAAQVAVDCVGAAVPAGNGLDHEGGAAGAVARCEDAGSTGRERL